MKFKLLGWLALALVLALSLAQVLPAASAPSGDLTRVWVEYRQGERPLVERLLQNVGAEFHYTFDDLNAFVVSLPVSRLAEIERSPNVLQVIEDAKRYMDAQTVPYGIDLVQARQIWDANFDNTVDPGAPTGAGRTVCIIDSGLFTGHEDFQGVNVIGGYPSNWNTDSCGHGTHVAGTIAAMNNSLGVVGVTPGNTNLYIVKVFGDNCAWTYSSTLADAANRCQSAGANVINMSLGGGTQNPLERRTFDNLNAAGILSIAAAGNTGLNENHYPASYSSVLGVAAVDQNKVVADFSTSNADVELAAPGVGVLSTVPYLADAYVQVDGVKYNGNHIEYAPYGDASGVLANGGLCDATNGAWSGKVVLCERGVISFYDKVHNVQLSGGSAAVLYNNAPGNFLGTLGDGNTATIPAISISQEDGQWLINNNKIGANANVHSSITWNVSAYENYDGTSMASPHVAGVAALVWSWKPSLTNTQIRNALNSTALDLGAAGRDDSYGNGLVQAYAAWVSLGGGTTPPTPTATPPTPSVTPPTPTPTPTVTPTPPPTGQLVVTVTTNKTSYVNRERVTVTTLVKDSQGNPVSSASVSSVLTTANNTKLTANGTTAADGKYTYSYTVNTRKHGTGTYSVTSTASKAGYTNGSGTVTFTVK